MASIMAEFHFLRPWWLALLPIGIWLIWRLLGSRDTAGGWTAVVDPALRAHVLVAPQKLRESRWPLLAALAAWIFASVALAGPAWERVPVPAFRSGNALVVALDLSRSMDAADVAPSRLARAKLKLLALLEQRSAGQSALVVFTTHAFTVTPLTTDTRAIAALVGAIDTGIMPSQGTSLAAGLTKAGTLLRQTAQSDGDILLISDADVTPRDLDVARELRDEGYRVNVLAVGTEQGAPIARREGGFLTDSGGAVVVPQLDAESLQRLASAGGGRFARLAPDDRDLDALFPLEATLSGATLAETDDEQYEADVWRDQGLWLAVALLPLLALGFRRGWVCLLLAWVALPAPRANAFEWDALWQRRDQRGYEALQADDAQRAAELFEDPEWRGAAEYRAGDFGASAVTLATVDHPEAHYNRGNALAKSGQLEAAIEAYERTLALDPEHEDARYNRDLLQELLEQNPEQQQPQSSDQSGGEQGESREQQSDGDDGSTGEGEQADADRAEQGEADSSDSEQSSGGQSSGTSPDDARDELEDQEQTANESSPSEETDERAANARAPGAEDVEQWASEQAAEQWLRRVPQDPGGLLRRKFLYQYQRLGVDQEGNAVGGQAAEPW